MAWCDAVPLSLLGPSHPTPSVPRPELVSAETPQDLGHELAPRRNDEDYVGGKWSEPGIALIILGAGVFL